MIPSRVILIRPTPLTEGCWLRLTERLGRGATLARWGMCGEEPSARRRAYGSVRGRADPNTPPPSSHHGLFVRRPDEIGGGIDSTFCNHSAAWDGVGKTSMRTPAAIGDAATRRR